MRPAALGSLLDMPRALVYPAYIVPDQENIDAANRGRAQRAGILQCRKRQQRNELGVDVELFPQLIDKPVATGSAKKRHSASEALLAESRHLIGEAGAGFQQRLLANLASTGEIKAVSGVTLDRGKQRPTGGHEFGANTFPRQYRHGQQVVRGQWQMAADQGTEARCKALLQCDSRPISHSPPIPLPVIRNYAATASDPSRRLNLGIKFRAC